MKFRLSLLVFKQGSADAARRGTKGGVRHAVAAWAQTYFANLFFPIVYYISHLIVHFYFWSTLCELAVYFWPHPEFIIFPMRMGGILRLLFVCLFVQSHSKTGGRSETTLCTLVGMVSRHKSSSFGGYPLVRPEGGFDMKGGRFWGLRKSHLIATFSQN